MSDIKQALHELMERVLLANETGEIEAEDIINLTYVLCNVSAGFKLLPAKVDGRDLVSLTFLIPNSVEELHEIHDIHEPPKLVQ